MLAEELAALAGAGATALIGAMATDVWQGARSRAVRLFGRGGEAPDSAIEARLDEDAALVGGAEPGGEADEIRAELMPVWRRRLILLLERHPEYEADLRALVDSVRGELPDGRQVWTQQNTARDHGTLFAVQGGNLHYHPAADGRVPPPDDRDDRGDRGDRDAQAAQDTQDARGGQGDRGGRGGTGGAR
ncbi:hypothetical protein [Streptomyces sp. NPDC053541]|uniref:hypothetical protein n=1 Tax=Streptomyces sp. NPDC053541 TaxID=3365709 RepID=UPI0037D5C8BD